MHLRQKNDLRTKGQLKKRAIGRYMAPVIPDMVPKIERIVRRL
jgi:hypothetical protein